MAAGAPISESDLIAVTLNGLSEDYESFVDSIMLHISSTSLDELHGLLFNKELFMQHKKKSVASSVSEPFQAYATQYPQSQAPILPTPQGPATLRQFNRGKAFYRGNTSRGNNTYRGHNYRDNSGNYSRNSGHTPSHRDPC
ncbi:hypothetical protein ACFX2B_007336 [Malus domestica]